MSLASGARLGLYEITVPLSPRTPFPLSDGRPTTPSPLKPRNKCTFFRGIFAGVSWRP